MRCRLVAAGALVVFAAACDGTVEPLPGGSFADTVSNGNGGAAGATGGTSGAAPSNVGAAGTSSSVGAAAGTAGTVGGANGSGSAAGSGAGGSNNTAPTVQLFQHCSFGGWQVELPVGDYTAADLVAFGAPINDASSLRVVAGYEAVLYDADNFTGTSIVVSSDTECVVDMAFNDRAESIQVRAASGGSGGTGGIGGTSGAGGSAGAGTGGAAGSGSVGDGPHQACVDRINQFRATKGLPALARRTDKEACADGQAKADSESGKAHGTFNQCDDWAQNECPGWSSVDDVIQNCLQAMWNEGPGGGHYDNMTGNYTQVWCGFYTTPDGDVWSVQDFK